MIKRRIKTILLLLLAAAGAAFVGYRYLIPVDVRYVVATPRPLAVEISGPGLLDAIRKVSITARIQGFLVEVNVDKNDQVKKGQKLAELLSSDLQQQLLAAEADASAASSGIAQAESDRERALAAFEKAKQDYDRRVALIATGTVSKSDFTTAEAAFKDAQANLTRGTTTIERAKAQAASAEANVRLLQAKLAEATIEAPIDGVVVFRERNVGDLLMPGATLMQIVDPASIVVSARFDESSKSAIKPGDPATVRFVSDPNVSVNGRVLRLTRLVDLETREFVADIQLDRLPDDWAIGQRAKVAIAATSQESGIAIPRRFIARNEGRSGVWVARSGRAEWLPVTLGYTTGDSIQILRGLTAGEQVIDPRRRYAFQRVTLAKVYQ